MTQSEINNKKQLIILMDAYEDALENDYCSSDFPDFEGCGPNEIVNRIINEIKKTKTLMNKIEQAEIKGRTDALEWVNKSVIKWREESFAAGKYSDFYDDFADELEQHILDFSSVNK